MTLHWTEAKENQAKNTGHYLQGGFCIRIGCTDCARNRIKEKIAAAKIRKAKLSQKRIQIYAKKPKLPSRKSLIRQLDHEFSVRVRAYWSALTNGMCVFGCGRPIEHCFHFVTRAKYMTRWMHQNAVGSCSGCNMRYEFDPHFAIQWYLKKFGQTDYDILISIGNTNSHFSRTDLMEKLEQIKRSE